jgi:hypothetical protein
MALTLSQISMRKKLQEFTENTKRRKKDPQFLDLLSFTEKCVVEIETQASTIGSLSQQI